MKPCTPTGEEPQECQAQAMPLIEGGEPALEAQVVDELHGGAAGAAETGRVVDGFRIGVQRDEGYAALETARQAHLAGFEARIGRRGLIIERRRVGDLQFVPAH